MMKLAGLLALVACAPPTTPHQPIAPLPEATSDGPASAGSDAADPTALGHATGPVVWPSYPDLPAIPTSRPTGDPIVLPAPVGKVGALEHRVYTSRFEEHYHADATTRYQLTKRDFELDLETLALTKGQPSQLQVTARVAREWIALANAPTTTPRQDMELLQGTYQVDATEVTRGVVRVEGREQEELSGMFAGELQPGGDPMSAFMRAKKLRLGEVVAITDDEKTKLGGNGTGTFVLSVPAADAKTVTYALDIERTDRPGGTMWIDIRARGSITFDRATGARVGQVSLTHSVEHSNGAIDDTFSDSTIAIRR